MSLLEAIGTGFVNFFVMILSIIWLLIDSVVYYFISLSYRIFIALAQVRLFDNEQLRDFATRIYIVIGVVALFIVAYTLILAIINPDNASKGEKSFGKLIPNIALAIFGIAMVPTLFDYAYQAQHLVLCNNIIPRLFLASDTSYAQDTESLGSEMAELIFETFFYPKKDDQSGQSSDVATIEEWDERTHEIKSLTGKTLAEAYEEAKNGAPFFWVFEGFIQNIGTNNIGYTIIISTIAGGFCAYVFISLSIDMAIRLFKLSYLQLIAPLPILTIIIPGQKKVFKNWLTKTINCFIEVFLKIAAVSFAAYIIKQTPTLIFNDNFWEYACQGNATNFIIRLFARCFMLVGICGFIKQAPKLLSEILGIDSKGFKLGLKDKLADAGVFQAVGAIGGAATGAVRGKSPIAAISGGLGGFKNAKDAKSFKDAGKAAGKGANDAVASKYKRMAYARENGWDGENGYVKALLRGKKDDLSKWAKDYPKDDVGQYQYHQDQQKKMKQVTDAESAIDSKAASLMDKYAGKVKVSNDPNAKSLQELRSELDALKSMQVEVARLRTGVDGQGNPVYETDDEYNRRKADAVAQHAQRIAQKQQEVIDAEKFIKKQIRRGAYDTSALNAAEQEEMNGLYKDFQTAFIENIGSFRGAPQEYKYEMDENGEIMRDAAGMPILRTYTMKDENGIEQHFTYDQLLGYVNQSADETLTVSQFREANFSATGESGFVDIANTTAKIGGQIDQGRINSIAAAQRAKEDKK